MEAETGIAHISGYADPNAYRGELGRISNSTTRTFRNGQTSGTWPGGGYVRTEEDDYYYGRDGRGTGGYGADDGYGRPGVQGFERQQPAIDRNTQMDPGVVDERGGLSPNRGPQNAGSEAGWTYMSQAGSLTPTQQRMKRDFPPDLPPRPQMNQAEDNDQHGQTYQ